MPPAAIEASVRPTMFVASSLLLVVGLVDTRSRNSRTIEGGNLGALPNPPNSASKSRPRRSTASSSVARSKADPPDSSTVRAKASRMRLEASATSPDRLVQASLIASSSWRKLGCPCRGWSGK